MSLAIMSDGRVDPLSIADSNFDQEVLRRIAESVDLNLPGVDVDVDRWLTWMIVGGTRPKANKRTVNANGVNGIRTTQDRLCDALEPYYPHFDMDTTLHVALLERATRPLPDSAR
jgi:hypothetical protein